jgi:para-nitrobenzyl esterase
VPANTQVKIQLKVALAIMCALITSAVVAEDRVEVSSGVVEGAKIAASDVRLFKGIPFAAPPIDKLRWQAPAPVQPREGVFKADT